MQSEVVKMTLRRARWCYGVLAVIGLALSWASTACAFDDSAPSIRRTPETTQIPARGVETSIEIDTEKVVVQAMINDHGPFSFLLDPGIENIVLDDDVVPRADLSVVRPVRFEDRSLVIADAANLVQVGKIAIGDASFKNISALIIDLNLQLGRARGLDGIVGMSLFSNCVLVLDFPDGLLRLQPSVQPPPKANGTQKLEIVENWPVFHAKIGEKEVKMSIDTTSSTGLLLDERLRFDVPLSSSPIHDRADRLISDVVISQTTLKDDLFLGAYSLKGVPEQVAPGPTRLGLATLKYFAVSLDQKNGRVQFSRSSPEPIDMSPRSRYGLVLKRSTRGLEIVYIEPRSPADTGYLNVGETIVQVDGREVVHYHDQQLREMFKTAPSIAMKVAKGPAQLQFVLYARSASRDD